MVWSVERPIITRARANEPEAVLFKLEPRGRPPLVPALALPSRAETPSRSGHTAGSARPQAGRHDLKELPAGVSAASPSVGCAPDAVSCGGARTGPAAEKLTTASAVPWRMCEARACGSSSSCLGVQARRGVDRCSDELAALRCESEGCLEPPSSSSLEASASTPLSRAPCHLRTGELPAVIIASAQVSSSLPEALLFAATAKGAWRTQPPAFPRSSAGPPSARAPAVDECMGELATVASCSALPYLAGSLAGPKGWSATRGSATELRVRAGCTCTSRTDAKRDWNIGEGEADTEGVESAEWMVGCARTLAPAIPDTVAQAAAPEDAGAAVRRRAGVCGGEFAGGEGGGEAGGGEDGETSNTDAATAPGPSAVALPWGDGAGWPGRMLEHDCHALSAAKPARSLPPPPPRAGAALPHARDTASTAYVLVSRRAAVTASASATLRPLRTNERPTGGAKCGTIEMLPPPVGAMEPQVAEVASNPLLP